ncbi:T9SS type A sorting domain-containing protein, partial [Candidatus Poribacteria bacterium]|nr:T9SS type A sorting domain-containing protein [Candidatus Poribacteria bacterium]
FTMTHLYNAGESVGILQEYRKALYKLVNSLSWGVTVTNPKPIDPQGTIFYIDLRHYEWDRNDSWTKIEAEYPYHISFDAPTQTALEEQLGRLQGEMRADIPSVHVDWFVAQASLPPLYHDLLSLPLTDRELETRLEVDVAQNLLTAPGVRVWRAGTNNSGVSNNNRVIERHTSRYGAYWKSYDFAGSVGTQNIFTHPLSFTHDGGEVIFNLPNGLQAYYVTNASGFRLDDAPINIVSNPAASDPTVRNGLSCFGCHTEGMKTFEDEVRAVIESNATPAYDKEQALRLYVEQAELDALLQGDTDRYRGALEATGGAFGGIEPISRFHEVFQGPVDAAYAAAVVGLETEAFLEKIRENTGLQNIGLLVLDSPNGSMKRDAWTSNFRDILFALDFPQLVDKTPVVPQPDRLPGAFVHIPDTNLRAAIAEELGKSPNAPITVEEMQRLDRLVAENKGIQDLTGLQFATNLGWLEVDHNEISDLSPIAGLINLWELRLNGNHNISDLSPLKGLTNLHYLHFFETLVSDLSPLAGLINLRGIRAWGHSISDLSPLAGLTKLELVDFCGGNISDLTPIAGLTGLTELYLAGEKISDIFPLARLTNLTRLGIANNAISDISPFAGLTNLKWLDIHSNDLSDISPLAGLTNLEWLNLRRNDLISDVSPLARLTKLNRLQLSENKISDVLPLAGLTNLKWLGIHDNEIFDMSPLDELRENTKIIWFNNPAFPEGPPSIEGPWLWIILPYHVPEERDLLSEVSGGTVTETEIATHGAIEGQPLGDDVWTLRRLPPTGGQNINEMLGEREESFFWNNMLYGTVSIYSSQQQNTKMYFGNHNGFKVWLNGTLIYESLYYHDSHGYTDFLPVTLKQGRNVLLVATRAIYNNYLGFEEGTEYTVGNPGINYTFSKTPIHIDDTFTLDIGAKDVYDLAGWQFDITFDPTILEAISVSEGNFLKASGTTLFQGGSIDNVTGRITGLSAARLSTQGVTGTGTLVQAKFRAKSAGETELVLQNFEFGAITGTAIPAGPHQVQIVVEGRLATGDVNRDGRVSILDLILIARELGKRVPANSPVDLNRDGVVSILDLILAAQGLGNTTAAPSTPLLAEGQGGVASVDAGTIEAWIAQARLEDDGSLAFKQGIKNLQNLLASLIPKETALHRNYPNPFNPETWIPYQLAAPAEVGLTIYDMNGGLVRHIALGHQTAGMYRSRSRAVYWDGRNQFGGSVASGLYFYTLTAGDFTATRRLVILK